MPNDATIAEPLLLTIRETAKALSLCEKSIWQLTRAGKLPAVRIGRAVRYDLADVRRFISASKQDPPVNAPATADPDTQNALAVEVQP